MGRTHAKILFLTFACLLNIFSGSPAEAQNAEALAILEDFKLPEYDAKTGKLQFVLYGEKAKTPGVMIYLDGVLVDVVKEDIKDINDVKDLKGIKLYKIGSPESFVKDFWKDKDHSQALIETPQAVYDRSIKVVKGNKEIHLRSPMIDVDGVGFDADYASKIIHIRKQVKVVLRMDAIEKKQQEQNKKTKK